MWHTSRHGCLVVDRPLVDVPARHQLIARVESFHPMGHWVELSRVSSFPSKVIKFSPQHLALRVQFASVLCGSEVSIRGGNVDFLSDANRSYSQNVDRSILENGTLELLFEVEPFDLEAVLPLERLGSLAGPECHLFRLWVGLWPISKSISNRTDIEEMNASFDELLAQSFRHGIPKLCIALASLGGLENGTSDLNPCMGRAPSERKSIQNEEPQPAEVLYGHGTELFRLYDTMVRSLHMDCSSQLSYFDWQMAQHRKKLAVVYEAVDTVGKTAATSALLHKCWTVWHGAALLSAASFSSGLLLARSRGCAQVVLCTLASKEDNLLLHAVLSCWAMVVQNLGLVKCCADASTKAEISEVNQQPRDQLHHTLDDLARAIAISTWQATVDLVALAWYAWVSNMKDVAHNKQKMAMKNILYQSLSIASLKLSSQRGEIALRECFCSWRSGVNAEIYQKLAAQKCKSKEDGIAQSILGRVKADEMESNLRSEIYRWRGRRQRDVFWAMRKIGDLHASTLKRMCFAVLQTNREVDHLRSCSMSSESQRDQISTLELQRCFLKWHAAIQEMILEEVYTLKERRMIRQMESQGISVENVSLGSPSATNFTPLQDLLPAPDISPSRTTEECLGILQPVPEEHSSGTLESEFSFPFSDDRALTSTVALRVQRHARYRWLFTQQRREADWVCTICFCAWRRATAEVVTVRLAGMLRDQDQEAELIREELNRLREVEETPEPRNDTAKCASLAVAATVARILKATECVARVRANNAMSEGVDQELSAVLQDLTLATQDLNAQEQRALPYSSCQEPFSANPSVRSPCSADAVRPAEQHRQRSSELRPVVSENSARQPTRMATTPTFSSSTLRGPTPTGTAPPSEMMRRSLGQQPQSANRTLSPGSQLPSGVPMNHLRGSHVGNRGSQTPVLSAPFSANRFGSPGRFVSADVRGLANTGFQATSAVHPSTISQQAHFGSPGPPPHRGRMASPSAPGAVVLGSPPVGPYAAQMQHRSPSPTAGVRSPSPTPGGGMSSARTLSPGRLSPGALTASPRPTPQMGTVGSGSIIGSLASSQGWSNYFDMQTSPPSRLRR